MILELFHLPLSFLATVLRFGAGAPGPPANKKEPLILYEFEGCPFCRVAREALSEAGVAVEVRPCPKGGKRFRPAVKERGGKTQFPYLIDPNTNAEMYESADIAAYLRKTYGAKSRPFVHWLGPINLMTSQFGVLLRLFAGMFVRRSVAPGQPLEFYGAERDPRARLAKELLCIMEIPYVWRARAPEGGTAPSLYDPNSDERVSGAGAIRRYLSQAYQP